MDSNGLSEMPDGVMRSPHGPPGRLWARARLQAPTRTFTGRSRRAWGFLLLATSLLAGWGCRSLSPLPPVNLAETGWVTWRGQAVWQPSPQAEELAGELVVAHHPDGRAFLQFSKIPLPLVTAQMNRDQWQIQFVAEKRSKSGRGTPPLPFTWLHLLRWLSGLAEENPRAFEFSGRAPESWSFANRQTGERMEGFLDP